MAEYDNYHKSVPERQVLGQTYPCKTFVEPGMTQQLPTHEDSVDINKLKQNESYNNTINCVA